MTPPPFPAAAIAAARAAAKAYLRSASDSEDALIDTLAATAMALCEAFTGTAIIARDWSETLGSAAQWQRLTGVPVYAIGPAETLTIGGGAVALAADAYAIDIDVEGNGWVRVIDSGGARVRITYGAGSASGWADLPAPIAHGIVLLTAHLFEARGSDAAPPAAVAALWRPWRKLAMAAAVRAQPGA